MRIETPEGSVRARAKLNPTLDPEVVCGQHGWWQACEEIGAPAYDPFGSDGANLNLIISQRLERSDRRQCSASRVSVQHRARRVG